MNTRTLVPGLLLLSSMAAWSAEVNLTLTDDASIHGNNPTLNQGSTTTLTVHSVGPKQGLVRFDASSLAGKTVQSATLSLLLNSIRDPGLVTVHAVTSTWNEGTVTWATQPLTESSAVSSASISASNVGSLVAFDVTAIAQRWADGTLSDFGLLIKTSDSIRAAFDAKENSGGTAAVLNVVTVDVPPPPTPGVGTLPIILDLSNAPVVIDQPGHYILDRDWIINGLPQDTTLVDVQATATLDMRGFKITTSFIAGRVISIGPAGGTVLNGSISSNEGTTGITSEGGFTVVVNMNISGFNSAAVSVTGNFSEVSNSVLAMDGVWLSGQAASFTNNKVSCMTSPCLFATSGFATITGNNIFSEPEGELFPSIELGGDNNVFLQNTIDSGYNGYGHALRVRGTNNLIMGNIFRVESSGGMQIDGSENMIKDNIMLSYLTIGSTGIEFLQNGNFYRNNQMNATIPFELNGTTQNDLGGNLGF